MKKKDAYSLLARKEAYILYLASGEKDLSLLPTPLTEVENALYGICKEKSQEVKEETKTEVAQKKSTVKTSN